MKKVIVTGASSGIGKATAKKFIENGYFVIGQYNKNIDGIERLKSSLKEKGLDGNFYAEKADFKNSEEITAFIKSVNSKFNHVDAIVNNAGAGLYKLITETTEKEWDDLFSINVKSAYMITNGFLKGMISNQCGKIVNVSSMWGNVGASMEVCYSASKSALIGYTKALAKELAPSGINVNCVCPGVIDTPMNASFSKADMDALKEETPLGRIGTPEDVAALAYFLASNDASFITGQIIGVDGGFAV